MTRHSLRRLFAILCAVAFFSASVMQAMPAIAMPAPMDMSMPMAAGDNPDSQPMPPCKGMSPACMIDLGCIFLIGVAAPAPSPVVAQLPWTEVSYRLSPGEAPDGRNRAPDLRPPIRLI
jgi:hypothetical protein